MTMKGTQFSQRHLLISRAGSSTTSARSSLEARGYSGTGPAGDPHGSMPAKLGMATPGALL
jgi:hypothetical protein